MLVILEKNKPFYVTMTYIVRLYIYKFAQLEQNNLNSILNLKLINYIKSYLSDHYLNINDFSYYFTDVSSILSSLELSKVNVIENEFGLSYIPPNLNHLKGTKSYDFINFILKLIQTDNKVRVFTGALEQDFITPELLFRVPKYFLDDLEVKSLKAEDADLYSDELIRDLVQHIDINLMGGKISKFFKSFKIPYEW